MQQRRAIVGLRRLTWILVAYVLALLAAIVVLSYLPRLGVQLLWQQAAWADLTATLVIFVFSRCFRNTSFYDAYWSVAPPLLFCFWYWHGAAQLGGSAQLRPLLVAMLVLWWAVRLTHNWARTWEGLHDEDWRYRNLQQQMGFFYWPVSLFGLHLMPTAWVFMGSLGMYAVSGAAQVDAVAPGPAAPLGAWDAVAVTVGIAAIWIEMRADQELGAFRRRRESAAQLLRDGLWARCRHPNYLGEIGFWLAIALFGIAAVGAVWWVWLGAVLILLLFVGVSIPMIERKLAASKPEYGAYQQQTPMLLPYGRPSSRPVG